ncbi:hypothetical protein DMN91_001828 [Ooceraea biroi]|uniref:Uncharacterized protein n=1 Tax=Ooceraea biroi TaxID=2015173 RepID=A0A3L8DYY9_OOCBI|nr:hypothetical protein DMN91_001828 [Ooceraea biroi]
MNNERIFTTDHLLQIIAERKRYHESTGGRYLNFENEAEDNDMIGSRKKRLAMLDLMIAASNNNQMSDSDIREEVDTFVFEVNSFTSFPFFRKYYKTCGKN